MKKLLLSAIVILSFSAVSFGQLNSSTTNTATAGATIITPIKITKNTNLDFGTLIAAAGDVTLDPSGTVNYGSSAAFTGAAKINPTAATFTVTGNYGNAYSINISGLTTTVKHTDNSTTMALKGWVITPNVTNANFSDVLGTGYADGLLSADAGTQAFGIGVTLTIGSNQKAGVYTSSAFTVTVAYE